MESLNNFRNFFIVVFICNIRICETNSIITPLAERSYVYEDTASEMRLTGNVLQTFHLPSKTICALKCSIEPYCFSFNFCGFQICELNSEDVYSTITSSNLLSTDPDCVYFGLKKEDQPFCVEKGVFVTSQIFDGICEINGKRVNKEWGSWEREFVDSATDWKKFDRREVVLEAAHGGDSGIGGNERVIEWIRCRDLLKYHQVPSGIIIEFEKLSNIAYISRQNIRANENPPFQ